MWLEREVVTARKDVPGKAEWVELAAVGRRFKQGGGHVLSVLWNPQ
jgi:hypothetical protein